ncbi:MAG TPA: phosphoglycerate mutase, partial [Candidatus Brocadiales bacterium]|nr:phosphoglycerate mutase [Candidatus Brocadiales bacterium]
DEAGHEGNLHEKVIAIEQVDSKIIGAVLASKNKFRDLRILVLPDHYTPIVKRTHTPEDVPFVAYGTGIEKGVGLPYTEANANASGLHIKNGHRLIEHLISGSFK